MTWPLLHFKKSFLFALLALMLACSDPDHSDIEAYYITCDEDALDAAYADFKNDNYVDGTLQFRGKSYPVKFRVRGDTSRENPKKSLRFKFEETFVNNQNSLNLNAEYSDKSYLRQYLSTKVIEASGQPCFQAIPRILYLNDRFYGVYLEVESVNKRFLSRIGYDRNGSLIKAVKDGACLHPSDRLDYHYERKNHKNRSWREFNELVEELHSVTDGRFDAWLRTRFDYPKLINFIALNSYLANGSTNYHNYFLYRNPENGLWELIHWDLDKTLSAYDWMPFTYHRTSSPWENDNALIERCFMNEGIKSDVIAQLKVIDQKVKKKKLHKLIDHWEEQLEPWVEADTRDKIESVAEWKDHLNLERNYLHDALNRMLRQYESEPTQFRTNASDLPFINPPAITWEPVQGVDSLTYQLQVSPKRGFLEGKTMHFKNLTGTFFEIPDTLADGDYFWMLSAVWPTGWMDAHNSYNILKKRSASLPPKEVGRSVRFTQEGSPYFIPPGYVFDYGVDVTIDPGVDIFLPVDDYATFNANVNAMGSPESPIRFMSADHVDGALGIRLVGEGKVHFDHCEFHDLRIEQYGTSLYVTNSLFTNHKHNFDLLPQRASLIWSQSGGLEIDRCRFHGNGTGEGMNIHKAEGFKVTNSYFHNLPDAIEFLNSSDGLIADNMVVVSGDDGLDFNNVSKTTITRNVFFDVKDKGLSLGVDHVGSSVDNQVHDNRFIRCGTGIGVKDSSNIVATRNVFVANGNQFTATVQSKGYKVGGKIEAHHNIFIDPVNEWGVALKDSLSEIIASENYSTRPDENAKALPNDWVDLTPMGYPLVFKEGYSLPEDLLPLTALSSEGEGIWMIQNKTGVHLPLTGLHLEAAGVEVHSFLPNDGVRPLETVYLISGNDDAAAQLMIDHHNYIFLGKEKLIDATLKWGRHE